MTQNHLLTEILRWARGTDLVEVAYRGKKEGASFRLEGAAFSPPPMPSCSLAPVRSPGVGLYRPGPPGTAGRAAAGRTVREGESLGLIEAGKLSEPVKAPCAGRIVSAHAQDGDPVEYGQALFFIQP